MAKRIRFVSLFLIIAITLVFSSSVFLPNNNAYASSNIFLDVKNPSFESTTQDDYGKPCATDWSVSAQDFNADNVNVISTKAYDKTKYLNFEKNSYTLQTKDYIEIDGGIEYVFGAKTIFSSIDDTFSLSVQIYNSSNQLISTHQGPTVISKQASLEKWQETFFTIITDSQAKKAKIIMQVNAEKGAIGVDNIYGHKNFIKLDRGASICLEKNVLEIRFMAKVDVETYQMIFDNYQDVGVGMVLSPKQQVNSSSEFTIKGITLNGAMETIDANHWNNPTTFEQDRYYSFYCAFGQVGYEEMESFLDGEIVARAYIKYTENNKEKYIYSVWDMDNNCRSIRQVAQKAKQDERVYNSYTLAQKEIICAYIEGRVPNFDGLED